MNPKDLLYFYRIMNWENKVSGVRPIGYTIFGYLMAGIFNFLPFFLNALLIFGVLVFCYGFNDYFDWKIQKENNFLEDAIKKKKITESQAVIFYLLPLLFLLVLFFIRLSNPISFYLFTLFFILSIFYSIPPVRFKKKKFFGFIVPAIGGPILFLQGYFLLGKANTSIFLLAILLFLFQFYLEILHIIDDLHTKKERKKMNQSSAEKLLKAIIFFSFFLSLGFSFYNPFFLITALFWIIRFYTITKINLRNINKNRSNIFSPLLSLYEFLIYGILSVFHLF